MKIVEEITIDNADKVIMGPKKVKVGYDTETGKVSLNTPAIWGGDSEMDLSVLRDTLDKLEAHTTSAKPSSELVPVRELNPGDQFNWVGWLHEVTEKTEDAIQVKTVPSGMLGEFLKNPKDGESNWNTVVSWVKK